MCLEISRNKPIKCLIQSSIKTNYSDLLCFSLNKMHALDGGEKKGEESPAEPKRCAADAEQDSTVQTTKVPQSQQNGAALPEETATAERLLGTLVPKKERRDSHDSSEHHRHQHQLHAQVRETPARASSSGLPTSRLTFSVSLSFFRHCCRGGRPSRKGSSRRRPGRWRRCRACKAWSFARRATRTCRRTASRGSVDR